MSYEDIEFPPAQRSIGPEGFCEKEVAWSRPPAACSLFGAKISPDDVLEGELDDCYLVSALTLLATRPPLVHRLVRKEGDQPGKYHVRIWQQGVSVEIVEKAFAKTFGSYSALGGGNTAEALHDLTGRPVFDYNMDAPDVKEDITSGSLWAQLIEHLEERGLVACAYFKKGRRQPPEERHGLIQNHAYCVLGAREFQIKQTGSVELGANKGDGCFWMPWEEFIKFFNRLHVCWVGEGDEEAVGTPIFAEHMHVPAERSGGCTKYPTFRHNDAFCLTREAVGGGAKSARIAITIAQKDRRKEHKSNACGQALSYAQVRVTRQHHCTLTRMIKIGMTIVIPQTPKTGESPLVLLPSMHSVDGRSRFWNKREVSRMINMVVTISQVKTRALSGVGTWKANAGGGVASTSFTKNPQFLVISRLIQPPDDGTPLLIVPCMMKPAAKDTSFVLEVVAEEGSVQLEAVNKDTPVLREEPKVAVCLDYSPFTSHNAACSHEDQQGDITRNFIEREV
ncbi:hypothetical protein GUITHDRAFT_134495 [Guillardia theta CCMP2712]|uniref:Calpain catalytic domain-containing protein n=1 Tax=Guillardia theta (strain CCMP2712) TaxID=905079 RepID=L1JSP6_GUITC|nr:hypothetical protein GUITHDRAFT_134495 [Guillardia theta CCMP2712]EKX51591.1 hypothetical protein GUITHDRAFT_134495 [Guillardia theta CCMP2712]|eukprot:XP_005838571.1 hypothetical protein GUITHDRAFT_134495 [Guillardia theta CCMP2712]